MTRLIARFCCLTGLMWASWSANSWAAVNMSTSLPGVAVENGTVLLVALPLTNAGDSDALNVQVSDIKLQQGRLENSIHLPLSLGTITSEDHAVLNLRFAVQKLDPKKTYYLFIEGRYKSTAVAKNGNDSRSAYSLFKILTKIQLPPPAPGSNTVGSNTGSTHKIQGPYPALPQPPQTEGNEERAPTPIGSPSLLFPTTTSNTGAQDPKISSFPGITPTGAVGFIINSGSNGVANRFPPDPSAAGSGSSSNVVMMTGNLYVKYSTDGGATFTTITNLSTVFGDSPDGGYCCDQVVHYVPSIDRMVWLIQTNQPTDAKGNPNGGNRLRIAWAKPADIAANFNTAWTWFDVTSGFLGLGNDWLDYPDLSTSNGYLYASVDDVTVGGLVVARISYADMQLAAGSTVHWDFTHPADARSAVASHLSQNAARTMYWAGHDDNSHLRVFSWADGASSYSWSAPKQHNDYANSDYTSKAPDGQYWYAPRPKGDNITSAVHRPGELWFAWTAGRDKNFPQPYVVIAELNDSNFNVVSELQVWNPDHTYAYPALAVNSATSEVAISLMWGGGGLHYMNHAVGFLGDFVVWNTTSSDATFVLDSTLPGITGCDDASGGLVKGRCTRSGDYLSLRRVGNNSGLFGTAGYEIKLVDPKLSTDCVTAPGCNQDERYIEFGRPHDIGIGGNGGGILK
jgi:hypothetical protein